MYLISVWNRLSVRSKLKRDFVRIKPSLLSRDLHVSQMGGLFFTLPTFISKQTKAPLLLPTWSQRDEMASRWCDSDNGEQALRACYRLAHFIGRCDCVCTNWHNVREGKKDEGGAMEKPCGQEPSQCPRYGTVTQPCPAG